MCLINNGNSSKGKRQKLSRKIYPKLLQRNLRKCPLFYNEGRGRLKSSAHKSDFIFRRDLLKQPKTTTQEEINTMSRSAPRPKGMSFNLGLEEKIFFSLVTILTSKAEARNANLLGASLALCFHFFPQRRGKVAHCVSPATEKEKKKKSLFLNFQRAQITQRKQKKKRWSEIILKLNIPFFF